MSRFFSSFLAFSLFAALPGGMLRAADQAATAEARLREVLKNTTLQLRAAEAERDTLKAGQAESDQEKKALGEKVETLTKQAATDKTAREAAEKTIADLNSQLSAKEADLAQFKDALEKWKVACNHATDVARTKEGERAKVAADVIVLERKVADRETKNTALFKLGNEILNRYEHFGLGDVVGAREPFIGTARVRLENLVQDYQDKLLAQKVSPEPEKKN